jgi:undecaprenyl-diphosphatase
MDFFQAFWLAVIQGFTEFLPVSSSGHLALVPSIFGWTDQGLAFDVSVHVGTLLAALSYFRGDLKLILRDWVVSVTGGDSTAYSKQAWSIIFASVPVGVVGLLFEPVISSIFRSPVCIALATIGFGIVLWLADRLGKRQRDVGEITWKDVLIIGLVQVLALIPGTSRSGVTISAGLAMGLTRQAAARFSFLLAIPVIFMAGLWQVLKMVSGLEAVNWSILIFGSMTSALVAFVCIHFFLRYLERFSLMPFVIYRLALGIILLAMFM